MPRKSRNHAPSAPVDPTTAIQIAPVAANSNPPPSRRLDRPNAVEKYVDRLNNDLIEELGTLKQLQPVIAQGAFSGNEAAKRMLLLLGDPKNRSKSLSRLASQAGLGALQLMDLVRDYHSAMSLVEYHKSQREIAKNVIEDAKTTDIDCPRCSGWGTIEDTSGKRPKKKRCPRCKGKCTVRKPGSTDARKLMGEVVGWTKSSPGVVVNVNQSDNALDSVMGDLERAGAGGKVIDL